VTPDPARVEKSCAFARNRAFSAGDLRSGLPYSYPPFPGRAPPDTHYVTNRSLSARGFAR